MLTWRRVKLYLFGVGLGLLITLVLFKGRNFESCSPASRVTEQISLVKSIQIDSALLNKMTAASIPQDSLKAWLSRGEIDFSRSNTQKEPCREYLIRFEYSGKPLEAFLSLCLKDTTAQLLMLDGI
jgi:hypothetical protein